MVRAIALCLLLTGCGYFVDMGAAEHQARLEAIQGQDQDQDDHRTCSVARGLNSYVGDYAKCRLALDNERERRMDANANAPRPTQPASACARGLVVTATHTVCN